MKTSIIIITFNGTHKIPRLLRSIEGLSNNDFEVIIVDDGSDDNPQKVVEALHLNFNYRLIRQVNAGRASAKNKGASLALQELLWFIDDDMRVEPETLTQHSMHHTNHPGSICVGSQLEDESLMVTDIQRYKCHISNGWKNQIEAAHNPLGVNDLYMTSANVSISASLFNKIGGFDERLRDAEDLDLVYRAYEQGVSVFYNKNAVGYHMDLITCRSYIIRNRQYMIGYDILRKLKPHYMEINKRMHISTPVGLRRWLLGFFGWSCWVWMIDHFNVFLMIPFKIRFRFYEMVIFSLGRVFPQRKI